MFDVNIAILYPSERLKSLPKRSDAGLHLRIMLGKCVQKHDPPHSLRLLRARRKPFDVACHVTLRLGVIHAMEG